MTYFRYHSRCFRSLPIGSSWKDLGGRIFHARQSCNYNFLHELLASSGFAKGYHKNKFSIGLGWLIAGVN